MRETKNNNNLKYGYEVYSLPTPIINPIKMANLRHRYVGVLVNYTIQFQSHEYYHSLIVSYY